MAEAPIARKRAVPAARPKAATAKPAAARPAAAKRPAPAPRRKPQMLLDDEPETPNFALRLTEGIDEAEPGLAPAGDTFALRLNEALEAINAANGLKGPATPDADTPSASGEQPATKTGLAAWLAALDKLPPIRLPVGPAIPWRVGLPALAALVVVMGFMGRSVGATEPTGVQLPAQQTYAVQQEAPLFAKPAADAPAASSSSDAPSATAPMAAGASAPAPATSATTQATATQPQSIGVSEASAAGGFDFMDIGIKLVAVLGLAYGSLMLLKRFGPGGAGIGSRAGTPGPDVRVISSIVLAPNRSVHVIEVPGGKTLLVGATPTAVNLLAELPVDHQ